MAMASQRGESSEQVGSCPRTATGSPTSRRTCSYAMVDAPIMPTNTRATKPHLQLAGRHNVALQDAAPHHQHILQAACAARHPAVGEQMGKLGVCCA